MLELKEKKNTNTNIDFKKVEVSTNIKNLLNWVYPRIEASKIVSKTSVTELKKNKEQKKEAIISECKIEIPQFLQIEQNLTKAEIGTATHFVLQKIDLKKEYTQEELKEFIAHLVAKNLLTNMQAEAINQRKILRFLNSHLAQKLKEAKEIYQETPFYIKLKAKEIYNTIIEDPILVQGIIDLYFVDKNDNIVLVDYKTDYVENKEEKILIEKYKKQIEIYARAIQEAIGKPVAEKYIYSLYLDKDVLV